MNRPAIGLLAILFLSQGCLQAPQLVHSAWREARQRAGSESLDPAPPEVDWSTARIDSEGCLDPDRSKPQAPARYLPDLDRVEVLSLCAQPLHTLLVHEFLHAIKERERRREGQSLQGAGPEEEAWVQERIEGL